MVIFNIIACCWVVDKNKSKTCACSQKNGQIALQTIKHGSWCQRKYCKTLKGTVKSKKLPSRNKRNEKKAGTEVVQVLQIVPGKVIKGNASNKVATAEVIWAPCWTWKCVPIAISEDVDIPRVRKLFFVIFHQRYYKDKCLMGSQPTFLFFTWIVNSVKWPYFQQYVNQITLYHTSLLSLALPIFMVFILILLVMNPFFNQTPLLFLPFMRKT